MTLWLKVTQDEYELPIAVADSSRELALILHRNVNSIRSEKCHGHGGIITVEVEDEENE